MLCILLLFVVVVGSSGQLFLGPCPVLPETVKNVNLTKLSGNWYVAAKSQYFPVSSGINCNAVRYTPSERGLEATFTQVDPITHTLRTEYGSVTNAPPPQYGEYRLHLKSFAISLQYAVLAVDYGDYAVEYTCQSGALKYLARLAVLTRKPPQDHRMLNWALSKIPPLGSAYDYGRLEYVNHTSCIY